MKISRLIMHTIYGTELLLRCLSYNSLGWKGTRLNIIIIYTLEFYIVDINFIKLFRLAQILISKIIIIISIVINLQHTQQYLTDQLQAVLQEQVHITGQV